MSAHPFLRELTPTLLIAHRGGAALAPENTMEAFRGAIDRWRADAVELDVHVTSDGEVVVSHDDRLDRCTDAAGSIAETPWSVLATRDAGWHFSIDGGRTFPRRGAGLRIPRLAEVLEAFPRTRLNVELKPQTVGAEGRFAAVVREGRAQERVCVGSEHLEVAERLVRALPEACHFFPGPAMAGFWLWARGQLAAPPSGPWLVLDVPVSFGEERVVDDRFLEAAARRGLWVNVWTVDDPAEMKRLVGDQVGGIMTDRPDVLRTVLDGAA